MKHRHVYPVAALLGMQLLTSCCPCPREGLPPGTTLVSRIERGELPSATWLVRVSGACPKPESEAGTWRSRRLFSLPSEQGEQTYCQLVWQSPSGQAPDLQALKRLGVEEPADDPPVLTVATARELPRDAEFEHQVTRERLDFATPPLELRKQAKAPVRVAVLDTAAQSPLGEIIDTVGHGTAVGALIDEVACDGDPKCGVEVQYYPALPYSSESGQLLSSQTGAGGLGTGATLAEQIVLATRDWLQPDEPMNEKGGQRAPLVINISLGWSGCYKEEASLASEAAHHAIEYATCLGAVVVASGGNADVIEGCPKKPEPKKNGAALHMFPGLWANERISAAQCRQKGLPVRIDEEARPLLLGVGAVDRHDRTLSITDHGSDIVAYGQAVTVALGGDKWAQLTGTSMSAAAASGMIARALRHRPALASMDVYRALLATSVELGPLRTDQDGYICHQRSTDDDKDKACSDVRVHRLSLCGILKEYGGVECKPLAANAPISVTGQEVPVESSTLLPATPCNACRDSSCQAICERPANAGDLDARDLPWAQPQPPPSGPEQAHNSMTPQFLYAGLTHSPYAVAIFSRTTASEYLLDLQLSSDVRAMQLVVTPREGKPLSFALGDAKKKERYQYIVPTPPPLTAKVTYQLPDDSYEVSDVVVASLPQSIPTPPAPASRVH